MPERQRRKKRRFTMIKHRAAIETDVVTQLSRQSVAAALATRHHLTADLAASLAGVNALTDTLVAS
jgi:hypothetical protein